jgi:D-sedoheptulose 7-phosphate isomerase
MSDALHISGELLKSYAGKRPLTSEEVFAFEPLPDGQKLAASLERGLRGITLGVNPTIGSAVDNDFAERSMSVAQELNALGRSGDVLLAISTSGKARNLLYAAETARAKGITTILLTGPGESPLSNAADLAIHAPGERTDRIQENHILLYHCLCEMLEKHFFGQ